ncbi:MAG: insulinase family protein [Candidatus Zixiibacteriota bacterium]|nr:MAG: insulinase family protein [candidate division Zixibacteria bacterium]
MVRKSVSSDAGAYQKTILADGLRVVTERIPSVRSISLGAWVDVGSRNETARESGVTHLIEHTVFKGTRHRSAREIASSLESIGGSLNAFTSKEQTCYTARILDEHLDIAADVLSDLTCHARLTPTDIGREKLVVFEEIKEVEGTPSEHVHDLFAAAFWGDHPLGRPIMGDIDTLSKVGRATITDYIAKNYRAGSIVVAAAGSVSHRKLVKLVRDKFKFPPGRAAVAVPAQRSEPTSVGLQRSSNKQVHLCLGYPGIEYGSRDRIAASALQTYLGGGMSSVLFQKIREEKGLAYTVYMFNEMLRDAGVLGAYVATDKDNLKACLEIALKELDRVRRRRLPTTRLDKVKAQMKGQVTLGLESTSSRMSRLARIELVLGTYIPIRKTLQSIDKVTSSDILRLANEHFDNSQIALAALGAADRSTIDDVL